jgi:glycosyltransferase involved in cell wall biosynthesis
MKVLHISTGFPLSYNGGIPVYVRSLAQSQLQMGYEVHVLAKTEPSPALELPDVTLYPYAPSQSASYLRRKQARARAEQSLVQVIQREKFDIVHFHAAFDISTDFLERFSALRVPYVVSLHDYYFVCPRVTMVDVSKQVCREVNLDKCSSCVGLLEQNVLLRLLSRTFDVPLPRVKANYARKRMASMRKFLGNARELLAVSRRTAEIVQHVLPGARILVEQIGNKSYNASVEKTPSDKIRIVALGTLSKHKGADVLEALLKRVHRPDMEFHFYGRANDKYAEKLSHLGLICHGSYRPSDVDSIMSKSDIGLVLSVWEDNGPQVAMEFVNYKVPVLGTLRGGIPDIVTPDAGYLFEPDSPQEVDRAVRWLETITMEEIRNISSKMKRLQSPYEHAERVHAIYENIVSTPYLPVLSVKA